jgi:hypothetical protein
MTGDVEACQTVLDSDLSRDGSIDWQRVASLVARPSDADLPRDALALGITEGPALTKLATLVHDVLRDVALAGDLYEVAERLSPIDAVVLTNRARFLVELGDEESLRTARRLLQRAESSADRRFTWWRTVLYSISPPKVASPQGDRQPKIAVLPFNFRKRSEIRRRYEALLQEAPDARQERGYELEALLYETARLSVGMTADPAYRITHLDGRAPQIDGYFELSPATPIRMECRWRSEASSTNDVALFIANKLDVDVIGLFVSMSGFTEQAIARANEERLRRKLLLVDRKEAEQVFFGAGNLDDMIRFKLHEFNRYSRVYAPWSATASISQ